MTIPLLTPNVRTFDPGNWPIRAYNAQNGTEIRILYGNQRYNLSIGLVYSNITDAQTELFLADYLSKNGTFETFELTVAEATAIFNGWAGTPVALRAPAGVEWRYSAPPKVESVVPGVSTITIALKGVI